MTDVTVDPNTLTEAEGKWLDALVEEGERLGDEAFMTVPESEGPVSQNAAAFNAAIRFLRRKALVLMRERDALAAALRELTSFVALDNPRGVGAFLGAMRQATTVLREHGLGEGP